MELTNNNKNEALLSAVAWWEKKRILYNIIALFGGLAVLFLRSEVPNGYSTFSQYIIVGIFLFGANVFYTCSWGSEILLHYYFKAKLWRDNFRFIIFIFGCCFSLYWMFIITSELP